MGIQFVPEFLFEAYQSEKETVIKTLEGDVKVNIGDWIITGINGEKYTCSDDTFRKTYREVVVV